MRILVVEDDRESRQGAISALERICPQAQTFDAENARSALSILEETRMDLIFLDINMPGMSGLALLEKIRNMDRDVAVVMLTAYDQFSYAQQALRLGAIDYVVKPFTDEILSGIVERVAASLASAEDSPFLMHDLARWLMEPGGDSGFVASALHVDDPARYTGRTYLLKVMPDVNGRRIPGQHAMMKQLFSNVKNAVPGGVRVVMLDSEEMFSLIVFSKETFSLEDRWMLEQLNGFQRDSGAVIACTTSWSDRILLDLRADYMRLKALMEYVFYLKCPAVVPVGSLMLDNKRRMDERALKNLRELILKGDGEGARQALEDIACEIRRPPYMPVQRALYGLHAAFIQLLNSGEVKDSDGMELAEELSAIVRNTAHIDSTFHAYAALVERVAGLFCDRAKDQNQAIIQKCLDYLKENYGNAELTQAMMASRVNFSPGYFGNIFKQVTGESFVHYLNRLRVAEAQKLLRGSHLKVQEIAEKTGYSSVNYFIRVFGQQTQMSPKQYRVINGGGSDE